MFSPYPGYNPFGFQQPPMTPIMYLPSPEHGHSSVKDFIETQKAWADFMELQEDKKKKNEKPKDGDKDKKEESFFKRKFTFMDLCSYLILLGIPAALIEIKIYGQLTTALKALLQ